MNPVDKVHDKLVTGVNHLGLTLPVESLFRYLQLLYKWNQAYNLTAIRDPEEMVSRHLLDSLAILPWVNGTRLIDVGTGGGLPGIPLAIALPDCHIVLLDSNGKKIRFLNEVKRALKLDNVEIIQSRVENYRPLEGFDTITSRAFSDLSQMIDWTTHLIATNGIWLAMKGHTPESELAAIKYPYQVKPYTVEGINEARCCIILENDI